MLAVAFFLLFSFARPTSRWHSDLKYLKHPTPPSPCSPPTNIYIYIWHRYNLFFSTHVGRVIFFCYYCLMCGLRHFCVAGLLSDSAPPPNIAAPPLPVRCACLLHIRRARTHTCVQTYGRHMHAATLAGQKCSLTRILHTHTLTLLCMHLRSFTLSLALARTLSLALSFTHTRTHTHTHTKLWA